MVRFYMNLIDNAIRRDSNFKKFKSIFWGKELSKTLGIVGFGRIGQEVASANRFRNECYCNDKFISNTNITLNFYNGEKKTLL